MQLTGKKKIKQWGRNMSETKDRKRQEENKERHDKLPKMKRYQQSILQSVVCGEPRFIMLAGT